MAEVEALGSQDAQRQRQPLQSAPHGKKRSADGSLESEQRLSKRFDLLNLVDGSGTRLYIPVAGSSDVAAQPSNCRLPGPVAPIIEQGKKKQEKREKRVRPPPPDDGMQVEDTPHRVYIHDLAAELSDIESDEDSPIFLSDIEKHIAKIPKHILAEPELKATKDNQIILYNVPSSLTVPEEQDRVRRAIVEARARIREKQANPIGEPQAGGTANGVISAMGMNPESHTVLDARGDEDAMDIDD